MAEGQGLNDKGKGEGKGRDDPKGITLSEVVGWATTGIAMVSRTPQVKHMVIVKEERRMSAHTMLIVDRRAMTWWLLGHESTPQQIGGGAGPDLVRDGHDLQHSDCLLSYSSQLPH